LSLSTPWRKKHVVRRGKVPLILNLSTRWRWVANFMFQVLHPRERTLHPLNRRLDGLWIWSGHSGEHKNLLSLLGFGPQVIKPTVQSLWWLQYSGSISVTLNPQIHTVGKIKTCKKCWRRWYKLVSPPSSTFCAYTHFQAALPKFIRKCMSMTYHFVIVHLFSCFTVCLS
jgi:hypothetical protein